MPTFRSDLKRDAEGKVTLTFTCTGGCGQDVQVKVFPADLLDYQSGKGYIQNLFHYLPPAERELFNTAICGVCWDRMFALPDEEDDETPVEWDQLPTWVKNAADRSDLSLAAYKACQWTKGSESTYFAYRQDGAYVAMFERE